MLGIIISGHGEFASGFEKTLEYIVGQQEKIKYINFNNGMGTEELEKRFNEAIQELDEKEGVLFLTDLAGGTPFSTAVSLSQEKGNIKVIGGTNLPSVLSALELREEGECSEIIRDILIHAKNSLLVFEEPVSNVLVDEIDGI